jgi:hypothetical protein
MILHWSPSAALFWCGVFCNIMRFPAPFLIWRQKAGFYQLVWLIWKSSLSVGIRQDLNLVHVVARVPCSGWVQWSILSILRLQLVVAWMTHQKKFCRRWGCVSLAVSLRRQTVLVPAILRHFVPFNAIIVMAVRDRDSRCFCSLSATLSSRVSCFITPCGV